MIARIAVILAAIVSGGLGANAHLATPEATPAVQSESRLGALYSSNAAVLLGLPRAQAGEVAITYTSAANEDGDSVLVIVQNASATAAGNLQVSVTVTDANGALMAVGSSSNFFPQILQPGESAMAVVALEGSAAAGAPATATLSHGAATDPGADLTVVQTNYLSDQVIGVLSNPRPTEARGVFVVAACVSVDPFVATRWERVSTDDSSVPAGGQIPFDADMGPDCDDYLIASGTVS